MAGERDFQDVLDAAARLQGLIEGAVLVGGSAAAYHAGHRVSFDADHVVADLRERYDDVLGALEVSDEWATARVNRPVMILGSLDGVETGIRQLIRRRPLEVETVQVGDLSLRVPTLPEIMRIKAWLVLRRNATRDHLDLVALAAKVGEDAPRIVVGLDEYYADQRGAGGARIATQLAKQLADPRPYDLSEVDLAHYRRLEPRLREWGTVSLEARGLATAMLDLIAKEG